MYSGLFFYKKKIKQAKCYLHLALGERIHRCRKGRRCATAAIGSCDTTTIDIKHIKQYKINPLGQLKSLFGKEKLINVIVTVVQKNFHSPALKLDTLLREIFFDGVIYDVINIY